MKYRPCVCAVIRRKNGNSVLFCHRIGYPPHEGWQFPQGGIDPQKDLIEELKRELLEEIGTDAISIVSVASKKYCYDYPEGVAVKHAGYIGQEQTWVHVELVTSDSAINVECSEPEFDQFKWIDPNDVLKHIVDFKKKIYKEALRDLKII